MVRSLKCVARRAQRVARRALGRTARGGRPENRCHGERFGGGVVVLGGGAVQVDVVNVAGMHLGGFPIVIIVMTFPSWWC